MRLTAVTSSCAAVMSIIVNKLSYSAMRPVCPAAAAARPAGSRRRRYLGICSRGVAYRDAYIAALMQGRHAVGRSLDGMHLTGSHKPTSPHTLDEQHRTRSTNERVRTVDSEDTHHVQRAAVEHVLLLQNL